MSTLVFQDLFTNSGADTDIASWQSTEQSSGSNDWAYQPDPFGNGVTNAIIVSAADDKAKCGTGNLGHFADRMYTAAKLINAAGTADDDYKVQGKIKYFNFFEAAFLAARFHATLLSGYLVGYHSAGAALFKITNGVISILDQDSACTTVSDLTCTLEVIGTTITWSAVGAGAGGSPTGFRVVTDSTFTTGPAGFVVQSSISDFGVPTAAKVSVEDFEVYMDVETIFVATSNTITVTAPTIPAVSLTMPVTTNIMTLSAPTVGLSKSANRAFPNVRREMDSISQFLTRELPVVAYQDTSLIP